MILYFSATGNCAFVAKKIAVETGDIARSMTEIADKRITLKDGERLGIITPTYFWGLPSYVEDFLKDVTIENAQNSYVYYIATYGTTTGRADYYVKKLLKKKNVALSASYSIKTVDNWTVLFSVKDKERILETLQGELEQTKDIIRYIKEGKKVFIAKDKKPLWLCMGARGFYKKARKTKHLHVTNDCIHCGVCAKECPVQAIKIQDGKPVWVKAECVMCFKCLHRCPAFAIQYDGKTKDNGQYTHP